MWQVLLILLSAMGAWVQGMVKIKYDDTKPDFGLLSDQEIDYINNVAKTTWKAGRNFHPDQKEHVKRLMGIRDMQTMAYLHSQVPTKKPSKKVSDVPEHFDPRTDKKWEYCNSLRHIRDQGDCGSCWAVSVASVLSDRFCIHSQGKQSVNISAGDTMSCCAWCGYGCQGGYPTLAFKNARTYGIVSGSDWGSKIGCYPYGLEPCGHHGSKHKYPPCPHKSMVAPPCCPVCQESYNVTYKDDKRFTGWEYNLNTASQIVEEIFANGPMQASFLVYSDFLHYKSGIYRHTSGKVLGGHSVKIIGYGKENGTDYWIIANSWNYDWGENGYFRMIRGMDDCYIETFTMATLPKLKF